MSKKTNKWLLILSLIFLIIGMVLAIMEKPTRDASKFAIRIETHLQGMEAEVDALIKEEITLRNLSDNVYLTNSEKEMALFQKPYTIQVFKKDSLVFWNNIGVGSDIGNNTEASELFYRGEGNKILKLPSGLFYVREDSIPDFGKVISFLPIKYEYKIETTYLQNLFAVDRFSEDAWHSRIPFDDVEITAKGKGSPVYNTKGEEIFSVVALNPVKMPWVSYALFVLYLLAALFGILWYTQLARQVARTRKSWLGIVLLTAGLLVMRLLMVYFDVGASFDNVPIFSVRYPSNYFAYTVGDMLINTLLSVWVAVFFFKEFKIENINELDYPQRFGLSVFLYALIVMGILGITYVLRGLVLETDIPFDFDKIGDLGWSSILSIIGILFLMLMLFLFTYRTSLVIRKLDLNLTRRLATLGIAVILSFLSVYLMGLDPTTLVLLLLFSIIYIISFDLYVENDSTNILWIVAWLVIYSAFSSSFLYKYNQMKEWEERIQYAKFLTNDRDEVMENELQLLDKEISADGELHQYLDRYIDYEKVEGLLLRNHSIDLRFIRYKHHLHLFVEDSFANIIPIGPSNEALVNSYEKTDITLENNLRFNRDKDALGTYLLKIKHHRSRSKGDVIILLEFGREVGENAKISTELFMNEDYKKIKGLSSYEYAIYRNNERVFQEGDSYELLVADIENLPDRGKYRFEKKGGKSHLIYHEWNSNLAMMNIELPNFISKVRLLMSYLFSMMVLVLGVLMIINTLIEMYSFDREPIFAPSPSLKNKIQVSVIAIIILSFFVIGVVTIVFFEGKNDEYHEGRLGRKAKSIRKDTAREIEQRNIDAYSLYKFKGIVDPVSTIHSMDINIYDLDGRLIQSSGEDIYSKGLISPLMNAAALYEMRALGKDRVTMDKENAEQIGNLIYDAHYETLKDNAGNVIAYIGMPYYSQKSSIQNDTSEFIGRLLNLYVVLLAVAGFIAIFVANSITKPLSQIGDKLKDLKIGKKNEPLEWNSKDELGDLIDEYNRMIKKLDNSTMLLAQSERENAWREMAKQVAHEIKNPLTPMKLSIQYLQHAYHSNPANMESMLKRVCNTLVEQIDNLSHIATEFSNFAKMPRAENERFELKHLVQSVYDLFSEQREMDMSITLPTQSLMVFADKNQLMRVFNNLIKNAMQAIPEERTGKIVVKLREIRNDTVQLVVKDNGSGIPKDMEEFIFVPHITTKSSGTGLGLAISKSIIEALDGSIYFKSIEGVGTAFFVELPISKESEELV